MKNLRPRIVVQQVIMVSIAISFLTILPFSVNSNTLYADNTDQDLFTEMETETQKDTNANQSSWVQQFGENLEGSFRLRYSHFFSTPHKTNLNDYESDVGEALFRFSTWSGKDNFKVQLSGWAEAGSQDDSYEGVVHWPIDNDNDRRYFELNELYAFYTGDNFDFTIGKKIFDTGICTLFSPSDIFSPADLHDPLDPKQLGVWQIKTDYYHNNHTFEFAVMPIYTNTKSASKDSRWWGDTSHLLAIQSFVNNLNKVVRDYIITPDEPDISWEYMGYFAKYKTTQKGWDLFISASSSPSPYSVLKIDWLELREEKVRVNTVATGFSTTWGDFEIHGEVAYNRSEKNRDDDYINYVIGLNYTLNDFAHYFLMEEILFTIEYAKEKIIDKQDFFPYILSSRYGRLGRDDLFFRTQLKYDEDLKFENMFHYQFEDSSWMNRFQASYRFREGWTVTGAVEFFNKNNNDINLGSQLFYESFSYGNWDKNDRFILSLKYEF